MISRRSIFGFLGTLPLAPFAAAKSASYVARVEHVPDVITTIEVVGFDVAGWDGSVGFASFNVAAADLKFVAERKFSADEIALASGRARDRAMCPAVARSFGRAG